MLQTYPTSQPTAADRSKREAGSFENMLGAVEVVSFDLFDTLIHRTGLFSPKDLFYQVQAQAQQQLDLNLDDFAMQRVRAEERSRVRAKGRGLQETTLDEIYADLGDRLRLDRETAQRIKTIELACERAALTALDSGKRLFDTALAAGKKVIIVTDTYFDQAFIADILQQHGYGAAHAIFVSSAYGQSKAEGGLYERVLRELNLRPRHVLHVGDNQLVDVTVALGKGMRAWFVPTPKQRLKWRHGLGDLPSGNLVVSTMLHDLSHKPAPETADPQTIISQIATTNLALLYFGYATWLLGQLRASRYRRVYFAARDGLIMKRCFDMVADAAGYAIDSRYLYVSRAALYPSLIHTDPPTARQLFAHNWDHLTVDGALRRIGLSYEACAKELANYRLTTGTMLLSSETTDRFAAFLRDMWPLLEQKHHERYQLTLAYLRQEMLLNDEPAAFVDIGWHGSLQNCLVKLLKHLQIDKDLGGYYLGTFQNPTGKSDGFKAQGYLVDNSEPAPIANLMRYGPSLIELFHGAGHGSVLGYQRTGSRIEPVLDQNAVEIRQHQQIIGPLQDQALAFLREQLARQPEAALHAPDPGLVARMALRIVYAPTPAEATFLGRLQIASDFGGRMKSLTGALEWDLAHVKGDLLPDGYVPIWRPGFQALKQIGS